MTGLRQVWVLTRHQLTRRWRSFLAWGIGLGVLGALYVALYPSLGSLMDEFAQDGPDLFKGFLGDSAGPMTPEKWMGLEFLNLFVPVTLPFLVILIGTRTVAGDEERKNLDLLLGLPIRRRNLIMSSVATMAIALSAVLALTWVLTYVMAPIAGVDLDPADLGMALLAVWPLALLFGTFALFLSTIVRRAFLANVISAVLLVIMYLLQLLGQLTKTMKPAQGFSLFYQPGSPIEGDFRVLATLLMLAGAIAFTAAATTAFAKRDIYT